MEDPKFKKKQLVQHAWHKSLKSGEILKVTRTHPYSHPLKTWWYVVKWDNLYDEANCDHYAECALKVKEI